MLCQLFEKCYVETEKCCRATKRGFEPTKLLCNRRAKGFEILSQDYLESSARINHNFLVQILSQNYSELLTLWPRPTVLPLKFSWGSKMIKIIKIHIKMINLQAPSQFHLCQAVCYHITWIITTFITIIFLPAGSAAQFAPGAGGIKLSCALSTSSPHNHHMLPHHIIHHYSHYQVGDHSFNLCEFSSHAIPTTVKSIILVSFQKHTGLGSKPFFASIATMNIVSLVVFWGTVTISL